MTIAGRGISPVAGAIAGLVVWALHFAAVYMTNAIACARGLGGGAAFGMPLIPAAVIALTAAALAGVALIALDAWRRLEHGLAGQEGEDEPRFLPWLTLAIALLSALAILWAGLPAVIVLPCA